MSLIKPEVGDTIIQTRSLNRYLRTRYKVVEQMTAIAVSFTDDWFAKDDAEKPVENPTPVKITKWEREYLINGRAFQIVGKW